jgi:hypothetical protein
VHGTLIKGKGAIESDAGSRNFEKPNTRVKENKEKPTSILFQSCSNIITV